AQVGVQLVSGEQVDAGDDDPVEDVEERPHERLDVEVVDGSAEAHEHQQETYGTQGLTHAVDARCAARPRGSVRGMLSADRGLWSAGSGRDESIGSGDRGIGPRVRGGTAALGARRLVL